LNSIEKAFNTPGVVLDRWILRLGKSEEEAGKFEPWILSANTFEEDFNAYLACLSLTRLVDSVEERMKSQKSTIRAVKKEQRETAKALAREQEKLQKALDKAAAKVAKEAEKLKAKAEAKAERERLKAEKKGALCTSTSEKITLSPQAPPCISSVSIVPEADNSLKNPDTPVQEKPQPELITLTEAQEKVVVEALVNPPEPNEALKSAFNCFEESEIYVPKFNIPMEG
jgi:hypothetical protein